jgi:hypothetical protein
MATIFTDLEAKTLQHLLNRSKPVLVAFLVDIESHLWVKTLV